MAPVATPSSATTTVRSSIGPTGPNNSWRRLTFCNGVIDDRRPCGVVDAEACDEPVVEERNAVGVTAPTPSSGLRGALILTAVRTPSSPMQRPGDLGGNHHTTAGNPQHQRVTAGEMFEETGEHPSGVDAVAISGHTIRLPAVPRLFVGTLASSATPPSCSQPRAIRVHRDAASFGGGDAAVALRGDPDLAKRN